MEKKKGIKLITVYLLTFLWLELSFRIMIFGIGNLFNMSFIYYFLFSLLLSLFLSTVTKLFNEKINRKLSIGVLIIIELFYLTHLVFKKIFNTFFSITLFKIADQALTFTGTAVLEVLKMLPLVLIMLVPIILVLVFKKNINFHKSKHKLAYIARVVLFIVTILLFVLSVNLNKEAHYLFYEVDNSSLNFEKLGLNVSVYLDTKKSLFGFSEQIDIVENEKIEVPEIDNTKGKNKKKTYTYNNLDINFDELISNESNSTVKSMHEYFKNETSTLKNKYTGIYKNKNIVLVMGESLNTIGISEKYTPTLYKMANSGFVFNNFYTPVNLSTIGGEFQNLTGLFANLSMLSNKWRKGTNYFPFGVGNVFNNIGYKTYAYHANTYSFQDRDKYLKSIGFDYYLAKGTGLEKLMNCNKWPQSDLDMVDVTYNDFINNEEPFLAYYVSVSGHMPWGWSGNDMSKKNKELLQDSGYSEEAAAYIAANIELDKAMELLINKLDEAKKLDDTVFIIVPDHYPYSMNINTINELSDFVRDEVIGVNKSSLIIWNSKQKDVIIDKPVSQLDVLPTMYNLFGIDYDSRLIIGKDALSNNDGLVFFTNRSWISDYGTYYAASSKFVLNEGMEVSDDYVSKMNKIVSNKINMSKYIMEYDYYKKVLGD